MSDPYSIDDDSAYPTVIPTQRPVADPDRAERYLRQHRGRAEAADDQFSEVMRQRQQAIAETRATLNKTIEEMRQRRFGEGPGQMNLPLLALASGMLQTTPGVQSNFANELGRGLGAMGEAISKKRMGDADFLKGVADLQQRMGAMEDLPLKDAAVFARQRAIQEDGAGAGLEKALITSKADRPQSLGQGIIFDPKTGKVMNAFTGSEIPMGGGAGGEQPPHLKLIGSDTHGEDYLKSIPDNVLRQTVKSFAEYDQPFPTMTRSPVAMQYMQSILDMAKQYNPDFDPKEYKAIQTAMTQWRGSGKMNQQVLAAANATKHIGNLQEAAAGLDNNSFQIINRMRNVVSDQTDDPRVKRFQSALLPVVEELTKFLGGGKPAEGTKHEWLKTVSAANGPQSLQSAISEYIKIMHTQLENMAGSKNADLRLKGDRRATPESLLTLGGGEGHAETAADVVANVLKNDISTPAGLFAVRRRGENTERGLKKESPLPSFTADQFSAAAKQLRNPTDPNLKKLSEKERRALFDEYFGPGAAAAALGK